MARIMVVDDEPSVRTSLRLLLERAGHEVREAGDGLLALKDLDKSPADLVITDVFMPKMDGIEALPSFKKTPSHPKVLAISGGWCHFSSSNVLSMAEHLGADAALTKPVDKDTLLQTVAKLLT